MKKVEADTMAGLEALLAAAGVEEKKSAEQPVKKEAKTRSSVLKKSNSDDRLDDKDTLAEQEKKALEGIMKVMKLDGEAKEEFMRDFGL